jgi:superfamily II DNA or RNA helicase
MTETVVLRREGRIVIANGPPGRRLPAKADEWIRERLTYYERKLNYEMLGGGGNPTELVERQLFQPDYKSGAVLFPIGQLGRVSRGLKELGFQVVKTGKTLAELDPTAQDLNWDGLFADFTIYPGQDTCLAKVVAAESGGVISATTGAGKAQPLTATVMTPAGPRTMGSIKVGDTVCTPHGGTTQVIAVHPQGVKQIYRVTFSDGRQVRCCADHLWAVRSRGPGSKVRVMSTRDMIAASQTPLADGGSRFYVDACRPAAFDHTPVPVPAYTLGVLLGDGSLTQSTVKWSKPDQEIRDAVSAELPDGLTLSTSPQTGETRIVGVEGFRSKNNGHDPDWHPYRAALASMGLMGTSSLGKFIPAEYLYNSVEVRGAVLAGLIDTDGHVAPDGRYVEYSTSSPRLAHDFRFLVESLGGTTSWAVKKTTHADSYRMIVKLPAIRRYLRLSRKRDRAVDRTKYGTITRAIRSIEPDGTEEAKCITVASADGLYLTDHFVTTHNSVLVRMLCRLFHKSTIHIVTKSAVLADEIFKDVATVIPDVGFCGGGKKRIRRVTVFIADSLGHGMGEADLVLADEVHELMAPKYAGLLGMYRRARFFGFSATPTGRMDGRDAELEGIFGPVLYTLSYQEAQAMGRVVPITVEWLRVPTGPDVSGIRNPHVREKYGIWQNQVRNRILADRVAQFAPDEQVLIMVKTIEHAVHLRQLLPDFTLCYAANGMEDDRMRRLIADGMLPEDEPKMTPGRIVQLRKDFADNKLKKVIANMVWSTGVNFRHLAVLARADAMGSEIRDGQIPGRVCRRIEGVKESALLIDMHDDWSPGYFRKAQLRKSNYRKRGWLQTFWQPANRDTTGVHT